MVADENLDNLVKERFRELHTKLKPNERKFMNPKSMENFILFLIDKPQINPKKNKTLQELGEIRMKKQLIEYFKAVENTELTRHSAYDLYVRYVMKIGQFMTEYYKFSGDGGNFLFSLLLILTVGISIDTILILIKWIDLPIFTMMFLTLYFIRRFIKLKQRKQFGLFY